MKDIHDSNRHMISHVLKQKCTIKKFNGIAFAYVDESVTSGQIEIDLKYGIFPVHQKTDLCDALKTAGQACPLQKGIQTLSIVETIPSAAPGVSYCIIIIIM